MHTTRLRKVGGSIMLAVPPAILDVLRLGAGATVGLSIDGERLVIEASPKPRYRLEELLAQCDATAAMTEEDRHWVATSPAGAELL